MKLKICGIKNKRTLIELAEKNIWPDYIGFVFAKSKRQVTMQQVSAWKTHIPENIPTVGVFVNPGLNEVVNAPVDIIQLHGDESPDYCQQVKDITGKKIWKAISVKEGESNVYYQEYLKVVDAFLFDTAGPNRGGNGIKFNWQNYKRIWESIDKKIIVAGGIKEEAIKKLKHYPVDTVDISSGVEVNGEKSVEKIIGVIKETKL